jgi:hypothetical protein
MNAHVETLRKILDAMREASPQCAGFADRIAALEAQGEVAWQYRLRVMVTEEWGTWTPWAPCAGKDHYESMLDGKLNSEGLQYQVRSLYTHPPSSPAMRAVVED